MFEPHIESIDDLRLRLSKGFRAPSSEVVSSHDLEKAVDGVISEAWLDPEDKAIRRRIRVVETGFKYPRLRLEEEVTWNPGRARFEAALHASSVADHLLVMPARGSNPEDVIWKLEEQGFPVRGMAGDMLLVGVGDSGGALAQLDAIERLEALEQFIDYAEPDHLVFPCAVPNDPRYLAGDQWSLHNTLQSLESDFDADIDALEAWSVRSSASNITVAVLDTGVRHTHEDLVNRMWDDGSGNPGWDAYDDDTDPMDTDGHGTHCAGIIGAQGNNNKGIAGVAWDVNIMAVRFIGEFGGTTSDAIRSINFARENGADIISASWGGSGYSRGLLAAIEACYEADIPVVTAAGNERWDVDAKPQYPASYPTPNIVTVAATDRTDQLTTFSNYGYTAIDIAAPGENILSCGAGSDDEYRHLSGTSAATPHVAGALALAKAHHGAEPVDRLITRLLRSVDLVDSLQDRVAYEGRLNVHQLLLSSSTGYSHDFFNTPFVFKYCSGYWCRKNGDLTREPDEDDYSPLTGDRSAWFRWTAPGDGLVQFYATGYQGGDVSLVAFEGTIRNNLRRMGDNFAQRPTDLEERSVVRFYGEKDKVYTFSVDSRSNVNQVIAASISFTPGNDMISEAAEIPTGTSFKVEGNNCSATVEPFEYQLQDHPFLPRQSVWWKWTPSATDDYVISTFGSNFDTVLGVYKADGSMESLGTNDSRSPTDDTSRLELNLTGGEAYYILVASYGRSTIGDICLAGFPKEQIRFLQQPQSQLVRFGDSFELSVVADASSEASYEWFGPDGALGSVGDRSSILIPSANANDMGDYHVIVRDGEASGTSDTATITELALPPRFLFSPQDISTLDGTPISMLAKADGLQPVTYAWFKEGVQIGTGNIHNIPASSPADSGIYYVEATNPVGTTRSHPFQILVSTDTFGPFIYRNPGLPESYEIKYINGRHFAYGYNASLMISPNGENWDTPPFPENLDLRDIAHEGSLGLYVAVCEDLFDDPVTAVSLNGRDWSVNPTDLSSIPVMDHLVAGNGVFIGYSHWLANQVYTSTNGLDWTPRDFTTAGSETTKQLQQIVFHDGEFIGGGRGMIYRSTDGINWTEQATPNDGYIHIHDNQLATFTGSPASYSTSADGITWTTPVPCVNPPSNLERITTNGTRFYHAVGNVLSSSADGINWEQIDYDFDATTAGATSTNINMFSGPEGNLVALGATAVLRGTDFRSMVRANDQPLIEIPPNTKIFGNTIYQLDDTASRFVYSNDLQSWRTQRTSVSFLGDSLTRADGRFWAINLDITGTASTLYSGLTPALIDTHPDGTHNTGIFQIRSWNDELYGVSKDQVFKLDTNSDWQVIYTLPKIHDALERIRGLKTIDRGMMIWSDYGAVYTSLDSTTWVRAQSDTPSFIVADNEHPSTKPRFAGPSICEFDGKVYVYTAASNKMYVAATGFDFTEQLNLNPFSRLTAVPEGLLGIEGTIGWYSPDGTTWQQFPIHLNTAFFHHFNGTLLAVSHDEIYQAGMMTSVAPRTNVSNLVNYQSLTSGTRYPVEYSIVDPADRFDRVEFYLNGILLGQSGDAVGSFEVDINSGGEHVFEIRSYNLDGQVTIDYWDIQASTSPPDTLVETSSTNANFVWDNRLQRSVGQHLFAKIDDGWVGHQMPFSLNDTEFVFTPDSIFAVGPDVGFSQNVLLSRDGFAWSGLDYSVETLNYEGGWLLAKNIRQLDNGQTAKLGVSRDGITWFMASTGNLAFAAGNGVIVGVDGSGFGNSDVHTSTDGATWITSAVLPIVDMQFAYGYFHGTGISTYVRSTDGVNWTDLTPALEAGEEIDFIDAAGGLLYMITGGFNVSYMWMSDDNGSTWTKLTGPPFPFGKVYYESGIWFASGAEGIYASSDGRSWTLSIPKGGTQNDDFPYYVNGLILNFLGHEDGVTLPTTNGLWTTRDGLNWEKEDEPSGSTSAQMLTGPITIDSTTKFAKLSARPFISADGGTWFECPFVPASGKSIRHVQIFNDKLMLYVGANNQTHEIWESTDGINFTQTSMNGSYFFDVIRNDGTRMFAKGDVVGAAYDKYFASTDGVNWTQLTTPASQYGLIEILNGLFVIYDNRFYNNIVHSADGANWQTTSLKVDNITYGNGVFLASRSSNMYRGTTIDNLALISSDTSPYLGNIGFSDGLFYLKTSAGIWNSADGGTWQQLYSGLNGNLESIRDTIYLNANTSLRPLVAADLQITAVNGTPGNLAVGANINSTLSIRNVGMAPIPAATNIRVRGVLTRDGIFGNDDDIDAGFDDVVLGSELAVGGSTDLAVNMRVPGLRAGGQFKLILIADPGTPEMSRTNNVGMTDSTIITVDEFVLNIVRNGNGNVGQSLSAVRYANGTLVTLSATAARGSGFTGWGGDSLSPLSNITVMMDQDQNLTANFAARVSLNLDIQGNGTVDGWSEPGTYLSGQTANLTAEANTGWEFVGWAGGSTSTNPTLSLTMSQNTNLTAVFRQTMSGWKGVHFSPAQLADPLISGDMVDADLDGILNWQEYLHGSHPMDAGSKGIIQGDVSDSFVQLIYTRNTGSEAPYELVCEGSLNLSQWNAAGFEQRILSVENGIETVEARLPGPGTGNMTGFIRLRYESP